MWSYLRGRPLRPEGRLGAVSSGDGILRAGATVLLTGATGGIGQAIARALAERGVQLIMTARRAELLNALARELGGWTVTCDLAQRNDVEQLALVAESERVDLLVANAALPASGLLTELTAEEVDRMLEVNLRAPIALAHALAPGMVARHSGHGAGAGRRVPVAGDFDTTEGGWDAGPSTWNISLH